MIKRFLFGRYLRMTKMQVASHLVLWFIAYSYIIPISIILMSQYHMDAIKALTPRFTYLREVKGNLLEVREIEDALLDFNSRTPVDIVPRKGSRPIDIEVIDDFIWNPYKATGATVGTARSLWLDCKIQLARKRLKNSFNFKTTVIHEYLHCFGYNHVDIFDDIMYKYVNPVDDTSIDRYAEDLSKRIK